MRPDPEELESVRRQLLRYAENVSDPYIAREIARAADNIGPRVSGPSRARQRAGARRDDALRRYHRAALPDLSARAASGIIADSIARYSLHRIKHDMAAARRPVSGIEQIAFDAAIDGLAMPSAGQLQKILTRT